MHSYEKRDAFQNSKAYDWHSYHTFVQRGIGDTYRQLRYYLVYFNNVKADDRLTCRKAQIDVHTDSRHTDRQACRNESDKRLADIQHSDSNNFFWNLSGITKKYMTPNYARFRVLPQEFWNDKHSLPWTGFPRERLSCVSPKCSSKVRNLATPSLLTNS
jgi:hypothetical protein